jgi:hypothetical protein
MLLAGARQFKVGLCSVAESQAAQQNIRVVLHMSSYD